MQTTESESKTDSIQSSNEDPQISEYTATTLYERYRQQLENKLSNTTYLKSLTAVLTVSAFYSILYYSVFSDPTGVSNLALAYTMGGGFTGVCMSVYALGRFGMIKDKFEALNLGIVSSVFISITVLSITLVSSASVPLNILLLLITSVVIVVSSVNYYSMSQY